MSSTKSEASNASTQKLSEDFKRPLTPLIPPLTLNSSLKNHTQPAGHQYHRWSTNRDLVNHGERFSLKCPQVSCMSSSNDQNLHTEKSEHTIA